MIFTSKPDKIFYLTNVKRDQGGLYKYRYIYIKHSEYLFRNIDQIKNADKSLQNFRM